jgi:hypothetical protein
MKHAEGLVCCPAASLPPTERSRRGRTSGPLSATANHTPNKQTGGEGKVARRKNHQPPAAARWPGSTPVSAVRAALSAW